VDSVFKTPVSVLVLVYTKQLQVLLIERADKPGFWQSVTGSIEAQDANLMATAKRELMEETGIDADLYTLSDWQFAQTYEIYAHWRYRYAPGVTHNVEHVFGLELAAPVEVKLAPREHTAYQWVDWREAAQKVFSWTNVEALRKLGEMHQLSL
jgi:dATP pyrophosphohydrolase